jgi:hypothetical protein
MWQRAGCVGAPPGARMIRLPLWTHPPFASARPAAWLHGAQGGWGRGNDHLVSAGGGLLDVSSAGAMRCSRLRAARSFVAWVRCAARATYRLKDLSPPSARARMPPCASRCGLLASAAAQYGHQPKSKRGAQVNRNTPSVRAPRLDRLGPFAEAHAAVQNRNRGHARAGHGGSARLVKQRRLRLSSPRQFGTPVST